MTMPVKSFPVLTSKWLHMIGSSDSNHRQLKCLFNSLFERTTKETLNVCIPGTFLDESTSDQWIPSQRASNAESVFMSWGLVIKMSNYIIFKTGEVGFKVSMVVVPVIHGSVDRISIALSRVTDKQTLPTDHLIRLVDEA